MSPISIVTRQNAAGCVNTQKHNACSNNTFNVRGPCVAKWKKVQSLNMMASKFRWQIAHCAQKGANTSAVVIVVDSAVCELLCAEFPWHCHPLLCLAQRGHKEACFSQTNRVQHWSEGKWSPHCPWPNDTMDLSHQTDKRQFFTVKLTTIKGQMQQTMPQKESFQFWCFTIKVDVILHKQETNEHHITLETAPSLLIVFNKIDISLARLIVWCACFVIAMCFLPHELAPTEFTWRQASLWGLMNCGHFLKRFTNAKRLTNTNLFIWLSKNQFTIVVLVENRFTNHKRVHVFESFLVAGVEQWHSMGSWNRFIICCLLCKRTVKKTVHKKDHNCEPIVKNWFTNDRFMNNQFTNGHLIECGDAPCCGQFQISRNAQHHDRTWHGHSSFCSLWTFRVRSCILFLVMHIGPGPKTWVMTLILGLNHRWNRTFVKTDKAQKNQNGCGHNMIRGKELNHKKSSRNICRVSNWCVG